MGPPGELTARGPVLLARAVLLAGVTLFLGVAGHVTAEGLLPGPAVLGLLAALAVLPGLALLRGPTGPVRLVALLVGGQGAIHLALTATAGHTGDPVAAGPATARALLPAGLPTYDGRRVGSLHDSFQAATAATAAPTIAPISPTAYLEQLAQDLAAHAPMMAVHLLAAVGVGLWLAVGERALWTLVALVAHGVRQWSERLLGAAPGPAVPLLRPARLDLTRVARPPHRLLDESLSRRGPPVLLPA